MSFQNPRQFSHMISRDFTLLDKLFETAEYKKNFLNKKESNRNLAISNKKQTNKQTSEIQILI